MSQNQNFRGGRKEYSRGNRSRNFSRNDDDGKKYDETEHSHFHRRPNDHEQDNENRGSVDKPARYRNERRFREEGNEGNHSHNNSKYQRENFQKRSRADDDDNDSNSPKNHPSINHQRDNLTEKNQYKRRFENDDDDPNEFKRSERFKYRRERGDDFDNSYKYRKSHGYEKRKYDDEDDNGDDNENDAKTGRRKYYKEENDNNFHERNYKYKNKRYDDEDDNDNENDEKTGRRKYYKEENDDNFHKQDSKSKKKQYDDDDDDDNYDKRSRNFNDRRGNTDNFQRNINSSTLKFSTQIELKEFAQSDFFSALITAYINDIKYDDYFIPSNGIKFFISTEEDNKIILHYSPKTKESITLMNKAISCAECLMPFTPKTILYHNDFPNCAIEVTVNGSTSYETTIHLISKTNLNLPKVFNLDKEVIDFLCTKIKELSSSMSLYRIALTGEALSFSLDENHQDVRFTQISVSNCQTVFGKQFNDKNRLVVLISQGEEMPQKQKELDWMIENISKQEELIQTAANIAKGLVRVYHAHDLFVVKESPEFSYTGPPKVFENLLQGKNSKIFEVCDILYQNYTRGMNLIKEIPVKNLRFVEKKDELEAIDEQLNQLFAEKKLYNIDSLKKKKDHLFKIIESNKKAKKQTHSSVGNDLSLVKSQIEKFYNINKRIDQLKEKKTNLLKNRPFEGNINSDLMSKIEQEGLKGRIIELFGCKVFSSSEPIPKDQDDRIEKTLLKIERELKINAFCVEKLVSATIVVSHRATSPLSPEQFKQTIDSVCEKFSFIISLCSNYIPQENSHKLQRGQIGIIFIEVIDPQFSIIVVSEIKQAILGQQVNIFRIPKQIASKMMIQNRKNQEIISEWIKKNQLNSIKFNGENWFGSKDDVAKAYNLLSKSDTCIRFKEKVVMVPPFVDRNDIKRIIKGKSWIFDYLSNCIIVDNQKDENEVKEMFSQFNKQRKKEDENNLLGCLDVCEDQIPSALQLAIYKRDESFQTGFLCSECIEATFESIIGCFIEMDIGIDFEKLMSAVDLIRPICICEETTENDGDQCWPKIPIGQLLWNLINDPQFSEKAKAWLTVVLSQSLHVHPEIVTFCPCHPQIILQLPKANEVLHCNIKTCSMILCPNCNEWHNEGNCPNYKWEGKRCPGCGKPTVKDVGCNHITCICGAHWCYKCGAGPFKVSHDCYTHMSKEHGGYFT